MKGILKWMGIGTGALFILAMLVPLIGAFIDPDDEADEPADVFVQQTTLRVQRLATTPKIPLVRLVQAS